MSGYFRDFATAVREQGAEWLDLLREQAKARPEGESRKGSAGFDGIRGDGYPMICWALTCATLSLLPIVMLGTGHWVGGLVALGAFAPLITWFGACGLRAYRERNF